MGAEERGAALLAGAHLLLPPTPCCSAGLGEEASVLGRLSAPCPPCAAFRFSPFPSHPGILSTAGPGITSSPSMSFCCKVDEQL